MADKKELLIREIENDIEDIYCKHVQGNSPHDIFLNRKIADSGGDIYRLDINEDRSVWALESQEDFTLTLDELDENTLAEIEYALSTDKYTIGN